MTSPSAALRGRTLLSRVFTSAVALVLTNIAFLLLSGLWPKDVQLSLYSVQFALFPYLAQAIGGSVGIILDQIFHVSWYKREFGEDEISDKKSHFYWTRIFLMPIGLVTFTYLYEAKDWTFLQSSLVATIVGWTLSFPVIDALMRKQLRSLPVNTLQKARRHLNKVRSK